MLRTRHLPFAIGVAERDAWLACMLQAMKDTGIEESLRAALLKALFGTADWMPNRQESAPGPPEIPKVLPEPLRIYKQRQVP